MAASGLKKGQCVFIQLCILRFNDLRKYAFVHTFVLHTNATEKSEFLWQPQIAACCKFVSSVQKNTVENRGAFELCEKPRHFIERTLEITLIIRNLFKIGD